MAKQTPRVSIVILSFNTRELTLRAIESCLRQDAECLVIVVDNHSSDGSVAAIQQAYGKQPQVQLIARTVNDGFAAGNNVALKTIETPYVMLLNSDAHILGESQLTTLLEYMDTHPSVGILSPKVVLATGQLDPASHRGFPTPWNAIAYYAGLEKHHAVFGGYHQTWKDIASIHEIDACSGAAMVVRTSAMLDVGLMDEQFFMYGEDLDWCFRFKEKNWQIVYHPGMTVVHDKHTSGLKKAQQAQKTPETLAIQQKTTHAFYDAMRLFYQKHYTNRYPQWLRSLVFFGVEYKKKKSLRRTESSL